MESLVAGLVKTVLENLGSAVLRETGLVWGLKDELDNLESIFTAVQSVIKDAEVKQRKSEAVRDWLRKLKEAAYDAENILDEVATEGLKRRVDSEKGKIHKLDAFFSKRNTFIFNSRISDRVKKIRKRLDAISDERLKFQLGEEVVSAHRASDISGSRETSSLVNESEIIGRHEERDMIIEKLVDACDRDDLSVYAICGMGGIGKTTLSQLVYNDRRVEGHFDLRIWVCVSDDFSIKRLIRAIIESMGGCQGNVSELDPLQHSLREMLRDKRYLLVLDDIWNENHSLWECLKETLECGAKGSALMVTTRIEKVASMMSTISTHHLQYLSEEDSWLLFRRRAFAPGVRMERELETIGKEIVRKCGGVPLAVKAIGSLMRYKSSESEWLAIQSSETWQLSDDENGILPVLRLSYDNLTPQMRQCFAYCCIFPKDHSMHADKLVQLWMANGFVSSDGQTDLPLTARLIFKELVWRSFFQDVERNYEGKVVCKMHDLMHDLAESVMRNETLILDHGEVIKIPKSLRHLSFQCVPYGVVFRDKDKLKLSVDNSLRSLINVDGEGTTDCIEDFACFLSKQRYIRVLDLWTHSVEKLPRVLCKLEHLRFLSMHCYGMKTLPESLSRLHNLQTLQLINCQSLIELPKGLKYLKKLCFLDVMYCYSLVCTPPGLGELTCLQELSIFIVGEDSAHKLEQLKDLNLGGCLSIRGLDHVRNFGDAKSANLVRKVNLKSLSLSWTKAIRHDSAQHYEEVLEGLQPNQNIERIQIESYQGLRFPQWMSTLCFKNLDKMTLRSCNVCECLPPIGKLPSLTCLELCRMNSITRLDDEWLGCGEISFPALTHLSITSMSNLEEWTIPNSAKSFPCLTHLEIHCCPKLTVLPFLPTLMHLDGSFYDNKALLKSIARNTSVTELRLSHITESDALPEGLLRNHKVLKFLEISFSSMITLSNELSHLSALRRLLLNGCFKLEVLPDLSSLESLEIRSCDSLTSISASILDGSSLKDLTIQHCKKIKNPLFAPLQNATVLQNLHINGCPELESLPESIQQLTALRTLRIMWLERLCCLPNCLGSLQSLSEMEIDTCKNLKSLPDCFQSLKSLRKLDIENCPLLETRCKKPMGDDWPKIAHIPNIYLNREAIQSLSSAPWN